MPDSPPPIWIQRHNAESAFLSYTRCATLCIPSLMCLFFTSIFLFPRVEAIWTRAGLDMSNARWLMGLAEVMRLHSALLLVGPILLFVILEIWCPHWPRFRAWTVTIMTAIFSTFVLITITTTAIAGLLAIPIVVERGIQDEE